MSVSTLFLFLKQSATIWSHVLLSPLISRSLDEPTDRPYVSFKIFPSVLELLLV